MIRGKEATMQMLYNATHYDWETWLIGLMRSFFAGVGGALSAPIGPLIQDPKDYNLAGGLSKVLFAMLVGALFTGVVQLGIFLKTHGAPDPIPAPEPPKP